MDFFNVNFRRVSAFRFYIILNPLREIPNKEGFYFIFKNSILKNEIKYNYIKELQNDFL
jgi:hypothetical protein